HGERRALARRYSLAFGLARYGWGRVHRQHRIRTARAARLVRDHDGIVPRVGRLHIGSRVTAAVRARDGGRVETPLVGERRRTGRGDAEGGALSLVRRLALGLDQNR